MKAVTEKNFSPTIPYKYNIKTSDSLSQFVIKPIAAAYASCRSFVLADKSQTSIYAFSLATLLSK